MSLRKWAAGLMSAVHARGQTAASANKPARTASVTRLPHPRRRVNRLNRKFIKRITLAGSREKCTLILPATEDEFRNRCNRRHLGGYGSGDDSGTQPACGPIPSQ